ncbi:hypothetical protein EV360DRAFT_87255 [Lentinula raphanica]|nr:hypothetical protein EV360DRAFT_87255 [Lentinula raphanica]
MHPIPTALVAKMLLLLMIVNVVATPLPMRPAGKPHTKTGERRLGSGPIVDNDLNPVWRHLYLVRQIINSNGQLVYVNWKADISKDEVWSLVILSDEMLGMPEVYLGMRTRRVTGQSDMWEIVTKANDPLATFARQGNEQQTPQSGPASSSSPIGELAHINVEKQSDFLSLGTVSLSRKEYSTFTALLDGVESRVPPLLYINNLLTRSKESIPWVSARKSQEVEDFDFDETWSKGPFFKMLCMKGTAAGSVVTAYWWGVYDEIEVEFGKRGLRCSFAPKENSEGTEQGKI